MTDDTLRMRAEITDGFTAPLGDLRKKLREVGSDKTARAVQKDWKGVTKSLNEVAIGLRTGISGGFRAISISSLAAGAATAGVATALGAAILGIKNFANETRALRLFSNQIGLSVQQLRELKVLGEHFGVSWDTAEGSLKRFADNLDQMRRHWGEAYNQLRGMNLAALAEDIAKAPDMKSALDRALAGIKSIQNPVRRRQVAQLLLGSDQWAVVASEMTPQIQKMVAGILKDLPEGSEKAADQFAADMMKLTLNLKNLQDQLLGPLLPGLNFVLENLTKPGSSPNQLGLRLHNKILGMLGFSTDEKGEKSDLGKKQEQLTKETEKLRKSIEQTNRAGALLQNQSYGGIGIGGGGGIINAAYTQGGHGMRPPALRTPPMGGRTGRATGGGLGTADPNYVLPQSAGDNARINRDRWKAQLDADPALKERFFRHSLGENTNPKANQAVMEEAANRADIRNNRRFDDHGNLSYFQGYHRGRITPRMMAMLEQNYKKVFEQGSDIARGAIDNSSQWLSAKHERNGRFKTVANYGGDGITGHPGVESFQVPGWGESGRGERNRYPAWRSAQLAEAARRRSALGGDPGRSLDLLAEARRADMASVTHRIQGDASLRIDLNGLPPGSRIKSDASGMFRSVRITRGKPMQSVWD